MTSLTNAFQQNAFQNNAFQISGVDPSDGVAGAFDEKKYKEYQKRVKARQAKTEQEEKARRGKLRKELLRLYRGLPEEEQGQFEPQIQAVQAATIDQLASTIEALGARWEQVEAFRRAHEEESDLEMALTAIL